MSLTGKYKELKTKNSNETISIKYINDNYINIKYRNILTNTNKEITITNIELKQIIEIAKNDKFI